MRVLQRVPGGHVTAEAAGEDRRQTGGVRLAAALLQQILAVCARTTFYYSFNGDFRLPRFLEC